MALKFQNIHIQYLEDQIKLRDNLITNTKKKLNKSDIDIIVEEDERIEKFETIRAKNKNTLPEIAVQRCSSGDLENSSRAVTPGWSQSRPTAYETKKSHYLIQENDYGGGISRQESVDQSHMEAPITGKRRNSNAEMYPETGRTVKAHYIRDDELPKIRISRNRNKRKTPLRQNKTIDDNRSQVRYSRPLRQVTKVKFDQYDQGFGSNQSLDN